MKMLKGTIEVDISYVLAEAYEKLNVLNSYHKL